MVAILIGLLLSLHSLPTSTPAWLPAPSKATWLWDTSLLETSSGRAEIVQFAREQQLQRIYVQVNRNLAPAAYRQLIQAASDSRIEVHALDGAPAWALPEESRRITELVQWVKTYNRSAAENERFQGIQVDIEPYLLPAWTTDDQSRLAKAWLQSVTLLHNEVKKDSSLTTSAVLPFWLDQIKLPDREMSLFEAIMTKLDEAALMSYRDQAQDVIDLSAAEMNIAERLGKKVWIGLETNPSPDTPYITFFDKGQEAMMFQLAVMDGVLRLNPSYAGIVIHDYTGWRALRD
ncbi:hypothetical protein [Paenibacillus rigui]|uniref:Amidase n=1 Tax=Paenibacillus rigui TaxID=554312 RepID=A0A229UHK5_9BACL|nr:hypothetical protein [Paenibacillus rigui]OXM82843.1 hypothetical protein CF651_28810 [Paenibacillus rigui]